MANIYDVAKRAGVGIGTVSRVLNKSSHISDPTRQKVLAAIKALHYQPHTAAQSLARRRTNTLGCVIPFFTGNFFAQLLCAVQKKTSEFGNDLVLYSVDLANKKETFLRRVLSEKRVDGLLLVSLEITDEYAKRFLRQKLPIVLVDSFHDQLDSIKVDNDEGAHTATTHLIKLGYDKVAMIDGQLKSVPARLRLEGYKRALADHGRAFEERYFVACDFTDEADGFNREAGYSGMLQLLDLGSQRPRAVFVSSDIQAIGAMEAIRDRGLKVPDDVAVVGFDDIELAQYVGLTTMRQPILEMGELAVDRLMELVRGKREKDFKHRFATELIIRESCGAKRRLDHRLV
jgi:DNA-binding LacI/PurR family transcriptional regulator